MNFGYLLEIDKTLKEAMGGIHVEIKRVLFEKLGMDKKLISSLISVFELNDVQSQNLIKTFQQLSELQEIPDEYDEQLILIENISNRYLMIKEVLLKENELKFGILGLLFYLGLTCFDSLGQKEKYKTFYEWLISRETTQLQELQSRLNLNEKINFRNEITQLFENQYNPAFGVRNSFYNFIELIKHKKSYKKLLSSIDLVDNKHREKLDQNDDLESFKNFWMYSFRNDFTHKTRNLRWPVDEDWFRLGIEVNKKQIMIKIIPYEVVISTLECIKDGIEMKLNKIGIALV
jgi:hypothetical protein